MNEKEIKINGSRLKLVPLNVQPSDSKVYVLLNKKRMVYQFFISIKENNYYQNYSYCRVVGKYPSRCVNSQFWCIEKGDQRYDGETYTQDEFKIIVSFLHATVSYHYFNTAEALAFATRDENIITKFYKMYGKKGISEYLSFLKFKILDPNLSSPYKITPIQHNIPKCYERNKYSIQTLLDELLESKAQILVDPDLIGKYEKIGKKVCDDTNKNMTREDDKWVNIKEIVGNKERANISLSFESNVFVSIPANPYDIPQGNHEFKKICSMCIIRDGLLHQSMLGVRIPSKFAGKLKRLGVISSELLYKNEYLLDLTKLPIISKARIREVSSVSLAKLEVNYALSKTVLKYINQFYPKKKVEKSDKEKFLNSLGIYGEYYRPLKSNQIVKDNLYQTTNIVSTINYIKDDESKFFTEYHNGSGYSNMVLGKYFDSIDIEGRCISDLENFRKEYEEKVKIYNQRLRDIKFDLIMRKVVKFNDLNMYIDDVIKKVEIVPGYYTEVRWNLLQKVR